MNKFSCLFHFLVIWIYRIFCLIVFVFHLAPIISKPLMGDLGWTYYPIQLLLSCLAILFSFSRRPFGFFASLFYMLFFPCFLFFAIWAFVLSIPLTMHLESFTFYMGIPLAFSCLWCATRGIWNYYGGIDSPPLVKLQSSRIYYMILWSLITVNILLHARILFTNSIWRHEFFFPAFPYIIIITALIFTIAHIRGGIWLKALIWCVCITSPWHWLALGYVGNYWFLHWNGIKKAAIGILLSGLFPWTITFLLWRHRLFQLALRNPKTSIWTIMTKPLLQ